MGALDRLAHRDEEAQPLTRGKLVFVAELGDRDPLDQFHHEIRAPAAGRAAIQYPADVWVIYHGARLPLRFETAHDLFRVHSELDDLEGALADPRFELLRHVNH